MSTYLFIIFSDQIIYSTLTQYTQSILFPFSKRDFLQWKKCMHWRRRRREGKLEKVSSFTLQCWLKSIHLYVQQACHISRKCVLKEFFFYQNFQLDWATITVIYTEKPSADFSAKTITKTAEGFFLDGVSVELVALVTVETRRVYRIHM